MQPTKREEIQQILRRISQQHSLSPALAFAVAEVESGFIPVRISPSGAMGLMQLMPGTARDLGVGDPYDAEENARGGIRYLSQLSARYKGDIHRVAAAYNAGPGNVPASGRPHVKSETIAYAAAVYKRYAIYRSFDARR
jgi:soluble lytic murein transglycosylase-like protein